MRTATVNIIGAGPGGLAAAMLLAARGARVRVFERHPHVGGRTSSLVKDGFRFDLGPTFFLYPRVLSEIFASVGRDLDTEVPMRRLDPQYRLMFGAGGSLDATPDIPEMERQITALSPADATAFRRFMDDNRIKLERFRPILENPFSSFRDLFRPEMFRALPWLRPWRSVGSELQTYFRDPRLVIAFTFQAKYLGMSPFRCPSLFSILSFLEYEYGVFHPLGGCASVSQKMASIAAELGVEFRLDEPVEELKFSGRRVTAVRTAAGEFSADATVINADFAAAMHKLVPDSLRRRWTNRRIETKRFSCSTFMMYLGVDGLYDQMPHHTIYIAKDYEQNLKDIESLHRLSDDPSLYVQNACVTDPDLAPRGRSTLYVLAPVSNQHGNIDWKTAAPAFRERVLDRMSAMGLADLRSRIVSETIVTPNDWEHQHHIFRGATFNLAHNLGQMLQFRPNNRFEDLDRVYLVGGGTHPGSGLPVIYESARISAKLIAADIGLADLATDIDSPRLAPALAATQ